MDLSVINSSGSCEGSSPQGLRFYPSHETQHDNERERDEPEMMQDEKKSMFRKLKSQKGETISETLVALLISALALTMLAGAITASANLVEKSRTKMGSYYAANEAGNGVIMMAGEGTDGTVIIKDTAPSGGLDQNTYNIVYYENDEFTQYPVYSYKPEPGD